MYHLMYGKIQNPLKDKAHKPTVAKSCTTKTSKKQPKTSKTTKKK